MPDTTVYFVDTSILVERDSFLMMTAFTDVRIWTLDARLDSFNPR